MRERDPNRLPPRVPSPYDNERHALPIEIPEGPVAEAHFWLEHITRHGDVVELFAKDVAADDEKLTSANHVGYYDAAHLAELAEHAVTMYDDAAGLYYSINPVAPESLPALRNGALRGARRSCKGDIRRRRLLLVDIDPVRPPGLPSSEAEKQHAYAVALTAAAQAKKANWPSPAVVDSGSGYHLYWALDLPADPDSEGLIRSVLRAIADRCDTEHARIDTTVYDANRLARLPGTMNKKGRSDEEGAGERPHRRCRLIDCPPGGPLMLSREQLNAVAAWLPEPARGQPGPVAPTNAVGDDAAVRRARVYVAQMPGAVSGQHGHDATFEVACRLVLDFDLTIEQALPVIREYNQRCSPPWSEAELEHKLQSAAERAATQNQARGRLRDRVDAGDDRYADWAPLEGPEFVGYVPDFALGSAAEPLAPIHEFTERTWHSWVRLFVAWRVLQLPAYVPDVMFRQCWWGGDYPRNWLAGLRSMLDKRPIEAQKGGACGREGCLFRDLAERHRHFEIPRDGNLGSVLERFADRPPQLPADRELRADDPAGSAVRRFGLYDEASVDARRELVGRGDLIQIYWPALLFGNSPRIGWNLGQIRMLMGLVRELTRARAAEPRGDAGELIIEGNRVAPAATRGSTLVCPLLSPNERYVVFGGNGSRRGRGYQIAGRSWRGWLFRAGFPDAVPAGSRLRTDAFRHFLNQLHGLAQDLDLIVAGVNLKRRPRWRDLASMRRAVRKSGGREWLDGCCVRLYAPADWLTRWRYFFARRMGFRWIPRALDDEGPGPPGPADRAAGSDESIRDAEALREFMEARGLNQSQLASRLTAIAGHPVSRQRVSRHLSGEVRSSQFFDLVNQLHHPPPG